MAVSVGGFFWVLPVISTIVLLIQCLMPSQIRTSLGTKVVKMVFKSTSECHHHATAGWDIPQQPEEITAL